MGRCLFLLLLWASLCGSTSAATTASPLVEAPMDVNATFAQLMAGAQRKEIPWKTDVSKPFLGDLQRLEVWIGVHVPLKTLARRGPQHSLLLIAGVADASGKWFPRAGTYLRQEVDLQAKKAESVSFILGAQVLPATTRWAWCCAMKLRAMQLATPRLPRLAAEARPAPRMWRDLRRPSSTPWKKGWTSFTTRGCAAPVASGQTRRPLRVDVLINLFGSQRQPGRFGVALHQLVPALRILSEMQLSNGSLHITTVDAERRRILFQQENVEELKWPELRAALEKVNPDTIEVEALAGRKQNAAYFREVLAERLKAGEPAGAASGPKRVVIVLAGESYYSRGADRRPLTPPANCDCLVYYVRLESCGCIGTSSARCCPGLPRRFVVRNPEDFRKALAEILRDLNQL
jgi:hypothetical protein